MEENKKGQNTLFAVIGIATLVVAIIGATFAYFSAQAAAGDGAIQGGTNDVGASLTLNVERVLFGETAGDDATYSNLVPANIAVTTEGIAKAVNAKCVADGYTGCHLYKITASSTQTLEAADVLLQSFATTDVTDTEAWKFVVFKGEETTADDATTYSVSSLVTGTTPENFADSDALKNNDSTGDIKGYNIHKNDEGESLGMTANTNYEYYLLVYLGNIDEVQNPDEPTEYSATGHYSGTVSLNAAGGKVVASFTD